MTTKDKDMSEQINKIHKVRPKAFIWPNKFVTTDTSKKYPPHVMPLYLTDPNPLLARIAELEAINKLAVEFREASKITQARVNSEEFWATANEADIDEIELEETLARVRLFAAIDSAIKEATNDH